MALSEPLTSRDILSIFTDQITAAGGSVSDTFHHGGRLFARSVLPHVREVQPRDKVQGGAALRATEEDVWVHPYVFRQVCRNGAIMAHALESEHIEHLDWLPGEVAESRLCEAVGACCAEEAFDTAAAGMQSAREAPIDLALNLLPLLSHAAQHVPEFILQMVFPRLMEEGDETRFGLMNAVTSVARDTEDPQVRWRLEELGGAIGAGLLPLPRPSGFHAGLVSVG